MLKLIRLVHTLIWAIMVAAVFYIFYAGMTSTFDPLLVISIILLVIEVLALIFNKWVCPLTSLARKYTSEEGNNFDIYLPNWLAKYNKSFFGTIFAVGMAMVAFNWFRNF